MRGECDSSLVSIGDILSKEMSIDREADPSDVDITWDEIVLREPVLGVMLKKAQSYRKFPGYSRSLVWYGDHGFLGFKTLLLVVVGYGCRHDTILGTHTAYDIAYHKIYQALPE